MVLVDKLGEPKRSDDNDEYDENNDSLAQHCNIDIIDILWCGIIPTTKICYLSWK